MEIISSADLDALSIALTDINHRRSIRRLLDLQHPSDTTACTSTRHYHNPGLNGLVTATNNNRALGLTHNQAMRTYQPRTPG